jgi:hypothetical protein
MKKSIFSAIVFFLLMPSMALAEAYHYEPEIVTLHGTIKRATGSDPDGRKITYPVIKLSKSITVQGDGEYQGTERGVSLMHMVIGNNKIWASFEALKGKDVDVTGTLFHSDNGHHMTPVLIMVSMIVQADGGKQKKKAQGEYQKAEAVVNTWSEAHNTKDLNSFFQVFAPKVKFYGKELTANKIIDEKNRLLKKYPNFQQEIISSISCEQKNQSLIYQCDFTKRVVYGDKQKDFPSYLVIDTSTKEPRIIVESDYITDRNLK